MFSTRFDCESLISDPLHGYIPYTAVHEDGEIAEQTLIDHPWLQRMRRIHQLQSAWWVYPSAEHTRFQHVLGAMHLASRAVTQLYPSLLEACAQEKDSVPSLPYVECLARVAALVHDVGHGPYGHFFDDHYLNRFGLTHEDVGQHIIRKELAELIRGLRGNPHGQLAPQEILDPEQVAFLIKRPSGSVDPVVPLWLRLLRALFSGVYTVDNMDFVLRDSYMAGHGPQAFDLNRLLHYSFFTPQGLTLHAKGLPALERFVEARDKLFRTLYFHRTARAIDLTLADVFGPTMERLFPGHPFEHLDAYRRLTEWSLLAEVERWADDADPQKRELGMAWRAILNRSIRWKMACERTIHYEQGESELASIFTDADLVERRVRSMLPAKLKDLAFRADVARHYHRPLTSAASRQNFVFEPATDFICALSDHEQFKRLPASLSICRLYTEDHEHDAALTTALDKLLHVSGDDKTNM
jgi:HD superfamily phosphohydrolase